MSICVFFNIEHYTMPQLFYCNKTNFFMGSAYNKGFLNNTFNSFFETALEKGVIKKKRTFKARDFKISEKTYDSKHKLLCIQLPNPKKHDRTDTYLKSYYISFLEYDNKIEVLDIYGLQKRNSKQNMVLVVSFVDGDDDKIVFRGIIEDSPNSIFSYMHKVAFENYYPHISLSYWE